MAPVIKTFLKQQDVSDKKISVFCTHGGGGMGQVEKDVQACCLSFTFMKGLDVYEDGGVFLESTVKAWLQVLK